MSSFDPEVLRRLADADAALPPAPGVEFSPAALRALAARRARLQGVALLAASLLVGLGLALWPRPTPAADALDAREIAEWRSLRAGIEALRASIHAWSTAQAESERAAFHAARCRVAATNLRCELARARAEVVLASTSPRTVPESNR